MTTCSQTIGGEVRGVVVHTKGVQAPENSMTFWFVDISSSNFFRIPVNFKIKPLKLEHAKHINEVWPKKTDKSENLVRNLIKNNISLGLYNESDDLVA